MKVKVEIEITQDHVDQIVETLTQTPCIAYWASDVRLGMEIKEEDGGKWHKLAPFDLFIGISRAIRAGALLDTVTVKDGELTLEGGLIDMDACDAICQFALFGEVKYG
jgi:hypothetical protein